MEDRAYSANAPAQKLSEDLPINFYSNTTLHY